MKIRQGTISVLFGCHSLVHSVLVLLSWIKLFNKWPKIWQIVCIFIHDIGHIGLDYLDNYDEKKKHWILGAKIAEKMFGEKGYKFVAGHCSYSGHEHTDLYFADKYSWYIAPIWWLISNTFFEPKLRMGYGRLEAIQKFQNQVRDSIESGEYKSTHEFYMERCNNNTER